MFETMVYPDNTSGPLIDDRRCGNFDIISHAFLTHFSARGYPTRAGVMSTAQTLGGGACVCVWSHPGIKPSACG